MRILWDEPKRLANIDKHGRDFAGLTMEFFAGALVRPTRDDRLEGRVVSVIFRPLGREAISVISMRDASRRERMAT